MNLPPSAPDQRTFQPQPQPERGASWQVLASAARQPWADIAAGETVRVSAYLLLTVPLGTLVFTVLLTGASVGAATLIIGVGVPALLLTLWLSQGLTQVQRLLARALLGVQFPPAPMPLSPRGGWWPRLQEWVRLTLTQGSTYRAWLFHFLQMMLGTLCWTLLAWPVALAVGGLLAPLWQALDWQVLTVGSQLIELGTVPTLGLMLLGFGALMFTAALVRLLGRAWAALAWALLRPDDPLAQARRAAQTLSRAAGRVALLRGDVSATLRELVAEAEAETGAAAVQLWRWPEAAGAPPVCLAAAGEAWPQGAVPAALLPTLSDADESAGVEASTGSRVSEAAGGVLLQFRALGAVTHTELLAWYPRAAPPPSGDLTLLAGLADHAGIALQAAALAERASVRAEEAERSRLARELHDSVSQALYGVTLGAKTAQATLERDPARAAASLDYTVQLAEGAMDEMKALVFSLRPDALEEGGLYPALERQAEALRGRHGLEVTLRLEGEPHLSSATQAAAFRIAGEALHNVVKHARASQVWLTADTTNAGWLILTVRDNGVGFDPNALSGGSLGQHSMRERAAGVGGSLSVSSSAGVGTEVVARLPLAPALTPTPSASQLYQSQPALKEEE